MEYVREKPSINVIIPAFNEEKNIARTLESVSKVFGDCKKVILVDNGSDDATVEIAKRFGANTIVKKDFTIAGLRNLGATVADGNVLVFIDADVCLHEEWLEIFLELYNSLPKDGLWITGSRCQTPFDDFINLYWYRVLNHKKTGYINSGHLIVSRKMFNIISGFDKVLTTSEDHDFCSRSIENGGRLVHEPKLIAFHFGYPRTIRGFLKREFWHGRSDFRSFRSFTRSKIALTSVLLSLLYIFSLLLSILLSSVYPLIIALLAGYIFSTTFVFYKFGYAKKKNIMLTAAIQQIYFLARSISWLIQEKRVNRHKN